MWESLIMVIEKSGLKLRGAVDVVLVGFCAIVEFCLWDNIAQSRIMILGQSVIIHVG